MWQSPVVKSRLHRITGPKPSAIPPQVIKSNLEPLKQNFRKKLAQSIYYEKHPKNQSPLVKEERGPVHQRLGVKHIRLRRSVPLGTNTSSVLPKKKLFKYPSNHAGYRIPNTPGQFKRHKLQRVFSAQSRIERIRAQQRNNSTIKLRRMNNGIPPATNLTVQVKNPNFIPSVDGTATYSFQNRVAKFKMILNPEIQAEIIEIQKENGGAVGNLPPLTRITPVVTNILITDRFGAL